MWLPLYLIYDTVRLGTLVEISATGTDTAQTQAAIAFAFSEIVKVHLLMSYHDEDSDVSRINRKAYDTEVQVDAHTYRVLRAARLMAEASNGVFDITIAPELTWIGFYPCKKPHTIFHRMAIGTMLFCCRITGCALLEA